MAAIEDNGFYYANPVGNDANTGDTGDGFVGSDPKGGWGFGGGGYGDGGGGGGGGYSGGGHGDAQGGGGGGSYVNTHWRYYSQYIKNGSSRNRWDGGWVQFQFINDPDINITQLEFKTMDITAGHPTSYFDVESTSNGTLLCQTVGPFPGFANVDNGIPMYVPGVYSLIFYDSKTPAKFHNETFKAVYQSTDRGFAFRPVVIPSTNGLNGAVQISAFHNETLTYTLYQSALPRTQIGPSITSDEGNKFENLPSGSYQIEVSFKDTSGYHLVATASVLVR